MAISLIHQAIFYPGANIIVISKSEESAGEIVEYARFIHRRLPIYLRPSMGRDQKLHITFPALDSTIRALSTTSSTGVGFGSASLIVLDEFDLHEKAEESFVTLKPMIDAGGGRKFVILSARYPLDNDTKFQQLFKQAWLGDSNFKGVFIPWDAVPNRTQEWYDGLLKECEIWERASQYPSIPDDIWAPMKTACFFDEGMLKAMEADCITPIETHRNGIIRIYRPHVMGKRYCMNIEPSHGYDPFSILVQDVQSGEFVCRASGKLDLDTLADVAYQVWEMYHKPFISCERNPAGGGDVVIEKLQNAGIHQWYEEKEGKPGMYISGNVRGGLRRILLEEYRSDLFKRLIKWYDSDALKQHYDILFIPGEEPRPPRHKHDDDVMCAAECNRVRKKTPLEIVRAMSFKYKDSTYARS